MDSIEFNGDMYPSGHGVDAFTALKNEKVTAETFSSMVEEFNQKHHKYPEDEFVGRMDWEQDCIDFRKEYFDEFSVFNFLSDWVFIKNLSGRSITFIYTDQTGSEKLEP